ncbi:MAG: hypothetical protein WAW06_10680 [bacterium]
MDSATETARKGEKIGWIAGWIGSFLWLGILSIVWLAQGKLQAGLVGLVLVAVALGLTFALAPWRRPKTQYWRLMLPMYVLLIGAAAWAIRAMGGLKASGMSWAFLFLLIPFLMPLATAGRRKWDSEG